MGESGLVGDGIVDQDWMVGVTTEFAVVNFDYMVDWVTDASRDAVASSVPLRRAYMIGSLKKSN